MASIIIEVQIGHSTFGYEWQTAATRMGISYDQQADTVLAQLDEAFRRIRNSILAGKAIVENEGLTDDRPKVERRNVQSGTISVRPISGAGSNS